MPHGASPRTQWRNGHEEAYSVAAANRRPSLARAAGNLSNQQRSPTIERRQNQEIAELGQRKVTQSRYSEIKGARNNNTRAGATRFMHSSSLRLLTIYEAWAA
jgi:hypothetical protein